MKAITLWQPWASLVAIGAKQIETRSWATKYRGPLAIHAAAKTSQDGMQACLYEPFRTVLDSHGFIRRGNIYLPARVVIATCNLADCVLITPEFLDTLSEHEIAFGDYTPGRWAWILEDVKKLDKPVPAVGKQRLWEWDGDADV